MSISIAIPFYNAEAYLADAIRSVFAQSFTNWELILLDDGSTDRSLEIALSVQDPRVRVISDGDNRRLAARLNDVTGLARYDFIARMDADDLMSPDRLQIQYQILISNIDLDLVSCGLYSVLNDLSLVGVRGVTCSNYTVNDLIHKRKGFVHAALLARKTWYQRNQYDPDLPPIEDTELWIRAASKSDFRAKSISDPLYVYREEGNVTASKLLKAYVLERKKLAPYIADPILRLRFIFRSHLKSMAARILDMLGLLQKLQQRRNHGASIADVTYDYSKLLEAIKSTYVPGLDG